MARLIDKILPPIAKPPNSLRLKTGDLVELKSGGPKMTIIGLSLHGFVICRWFDGESLSRARFFPSNVAVTKN
jgi:uncharacterized protein YodC (DUF2158 family)